MNDIKNICVYSASSTKIDPIYFEAAEELGKILAQKHINLINGAGCLGLMCRISDAALAAGGYNAQLLWQLLKYRLRLLMPQQLAERCEASEGLENLLSKAADCASLQSALAACSSKRYTASRIRRLLLQILLDRPKAVWQQQAPAYMRVLAFNNIGRQLLHRMKTSAQLPIINNLGKNALCNDSVAYRTQLSAEVTATDLWSLLQKDAALNRSGNDFYQSPVYVSSKR